MPLRTLTHTIAILAAVAIAAMVLPAAGFAHARVSPAVSVTNRLQLYSLAVPTEKSGLTTTKIIMTVPNGFGIDSFAPPPAGWAMHTKSTGSGDNAIVQQVTWTGGHTPTGEDSLFQFLAQPSSSTTYTFRVEQTYSDGSIVNWSGPESSAAPAPTIQSKATFGGGGLSVVTIIALILGALGCAAGVFALVGVGGRRSIV